jgi:hypothetical protein
MRRGCAVARMLDERILSPTDRAPLSRYHLEHPLVIALPAGEARLDYEPAESMTGCSGELNWRGPIWFPLNFLALESLRHLHSALGDTFTIELPTGSGRQANLGEAADEIEQRLLRLFCPKEGHRPYSARWISSTRSCMAREYFVLRVLQRRHR